MLNQTLPADLPATIQLTGFLCQICTTLIAAVIGLVTFRYTKWPQAARRIAQGRRASPEHSGSPARRRPSV
jgi:hypothetical protein